MNWIFIGELEIHGPQDYSHGEFPLFMYASSAGEDSDACFYTINACGIKGVNTGELFYFEKRYSLNTILCCIISQDVEYGRLNGGILGGSCKEAKIRLVGNKEWIEVDEDFLHYRITLDELEKKYRLFKWKGDDEIKV